MVKYLKEEGFGRVVGVSNLGKMFRKVCLFGKGCCFVLVGRDLIFFIKERLIEKKN